MVCASRRVTVEEMRRRNPLWRGPETMSGSGFVSVSDCDEIEYVRGVNEC